MPSKSVHEEQLVLNSPDPTDPWEVVCVCVGPMEIVSRWMLCLSAP